MEKSFKGNLHDKVHDYKKIKGAARYKPKGE